MNENINERRNMKIVIGHYHLNPGGVTKIIQSQLNGLSTYKDLELIVISDGNGIKNIQLPENAVFKTNKQLGYLPLYENREHLQQIVNELIIFFKSVVSREDILHFHNIGLGKNVAVTFALFQLAIEGYKIINHAHDFSEDRPENHAYLNEGLALLTDKKLEEVLYPNLSNYTFGVLNTSDLNRVLAAGVLKERINLWANPVNRPQKSNNLTKAEAKAKLCNALHLDVKKKLLSYPVRVIKRKNIGEYILLSAIYHSTANFIVTLPPLNPVEIELYEKWVQFCESHHYEVVFEAGLKAPFEWVMKGSDTCFTTSVMEGFGMVYVEPWLWDTPVAGRKIETVVPDLQAMGLRYPLLYTKMNVCKDGAICEFSELSMSAQMEMIEYYRTNPSEFSRLNPEIDEFFRQPEINFINNNKNIIQNDMSEQKYGEKLYTTYQALS